MGQQGIYSLGYRLGVVEQQVVIGGLQLAWEPFVLQNMKSADATRLVGRAVTYSVLLGIVPALLLGVLAAPLMSVVHVQPGYLAGAPVVFIVALAQWFGFMRFLFMTPTFVKVRPEWAVVVLIGAGVSNIILNLWLIPRFGMMGAAWATLGAYIVGAVLALVLGLRLWKIEFEYRRLFSILVAGLATYWLVNMLEMQSAWLNLFFKFLATPTLFLLVLTLMWFWGAHEISLVRRRIAGFLVSENS
jgi:O-antigen/teichoic acid export membrane protein